MGVGWGRMGKLGMGKGGAYLGQPQGDRDLKLPLWLVGKNGPIWRWEGKLRWGKMGGEIAKGKMGGEEWANLGQPQGDRDLKLPLWVGGRMGPFGDGRGNCDGGNWVGKGANLGQPER
ncbi:uncharacterized protein Gasu_63550 [Galdieria sulphuraria]|uniref:Uncharacterized protein n=1 Tax=Galdieria sulphuraria TaxID=130081 RepID=M2XRC9_GALSU|nr:uncharacterized protein Gasu_63550 [Galdieria sulphuraria]EME25989.1 hypothetical protein Gasu_63550 [Galdieria sulphuraria]|eukprot:XP_005702509.1 hypothetical protein Gasu_63550 [Galdieria sulphuraria]